MTNTELLKSKIVERGVSYTFLAKKIGISRQALYKKAMNENEFTQNEIACLCDALGITSLREKDRIFFYKEEGTK